MTGPPHVGASGRAGDPAVLFDLRQGVATITLNRPRALNSLNRDMVTAIAAALAAWTRDATVTTIVLAGAGQGGLCAGGDVRLLFEQAARRPHDALAFWREEYRLVASIARLAVPYVALMHGVVMGGGVGLSAHGRHRVVCESSRVALPEVGIGFPPDVGGTWLLARAPGELGTHVALTAAELTAGDAIACGLADCYVPAARWPELWAALAGTPAARVLPAFAAGPPPSPLARERDWIDACYQGDQVEEILSRLDARPEAGAAAAAARIRRHSPTALKVTLRALREARRLTTLEAVLRAEYRIMAVSLGSHDFREGIRARIIDRDASPRWQPPRLSEVSAAQVEAHFGPAPGGTLDRVVSWPDTEYGQLTPWPDHMNSDQD